jgi:hypothetical protein
VAAASIPRDNRDAEKIVRVFASLEEADQADALAYARMTPAERLKIVMDLRDARHPDALEQGLARVCRVVDLESS